MDFIIPSAIWYNAFLVHKRHLNVYLGKLGLAVGPEVFIPETLYNLKVAVHAGYHEQLLVGLRTLR